MEGRTVALREGMRLSAFESSPDSFELDEHGERHESELRNKRANGIGT